MPYAWVTMNTREHVVVDRCRGTVGFCGQRGVHEVTMTVDTSVLCYGLVARLDLNRVVVILKCKGDGMKETVVRLRDPFTDKVVRHVAVVASCDMMVATVLPRIEVFLHRMAVRARLRVAAQITRAFAVTKRKGPCPGEDTQNNRK